MQNYRRLEVWKLGRQLVAEIYAATAGFPRDEKYCLVSQLRRAAIAVPSNIAEGCSRSTQRDMARFLEIALGSLHEIDTQILIAGDLSLLSADAVHALSARVAVLRRKLLTLLQRVDSR